MTCRKAIGQNEIKAPNWALMLANTETAMRALPLASPSDSREIVIPFLAEEYAIMAFGFLSSVPPPARKDIESQLSKIEKQADELRINLERLKAPAVDALHLAMKDGHDRPAMRLKIDPRPKALGDIMGRLETLIDAARRATIPSTAKGVRGQDRKSDALEIAKAAAKDYRFLTGKAPDRSKNKNGFPDFLAAIFKALDRRGDSVENLARKACEWWKKDRPLEDEAYLEKLGLTIPRFRVPTPEEFAAIAAANAKLPE